MGIDRPDRFSATTDQAKKNRENRSHVSIRREIYR